MSGPWIAAISAGAITVLIFGAAFVLRCVQCWRDVEVLKADKAAREGPVTVHLHGDVAHLDEKMRMRAIAEQRRRGHQ